MRTLARLNLITLQCQLHNHPSLTNMRPLHRHTQPLIRRTPPTRTNQYIIRIILTKLIINILNLTRYFRIISRHKVSSLHIHHIPHIISHTITQCPKRVQQHPLPLNIHQIITHHLLTIHNRPNLKNIKPSHILINNIHSKLNLHRPPHTLLTNLQNLFQRISQRQSIMLQNIGKRHYLPATLIIPIPYNLIIRIISRSNKPKWAILTRILHPYLFQIKTIIHSRLTLLLSQIQSIKLSLRIPQCQIKGTQLQNIVGKLRRKPQPILTLHNILAKPHRHIHNTIIASFITNRIIIYRPCHTRNSRIKQLIIFLPHNFLQHNSHLLLINKIVRRRHIRLTILIKHRSIHRLDRIAQISYHLILITHIRNHVCRINTRKGLILRILQQARRTNSNRTRHSINKNKEIARQPFGQLSRQKMSQYLLIRNITKRHIIQVVSLHKLIKDISTQHHRFGSRNIHLLIRLHIKMCLNNMPYKSQSTTLASQRTITYTRKI